MISTVVVIRCYSFRVIAGLSFLLLGALLLASALCAAPVSWEQCRLGGIKEEATCTTLRLFENRGEKKRKIPIHIAVLKSTGSKESSAALFVFAGGPGQAASDIAPFIAEHFAPVRSDRDLVFVDVRGTGKSNLLTCSLYGPDLQSYFDDLFPGDRVAQCRAELEERADLRAYTTTDIVTDLEEIRNALGYGKIDVYGTSYGTRIALWYEKMYPDSLRSAILHGPAPTDLKAPLYHAWAGQQSLKHILRQCAADNACQKAFPNLDKEFENVLQRLDKSESEAEVIDPHSKQKTIVHLSRGTFGEALRNMLYSPKSAARVPLLIHKAAAEDFREFAEFNISLRKSYQDHLAFGLFHSVSCAEDVPFISEKDIARETRETFLGDYRIRQQQAACRNWSQASIARDFRSPVRSSVPTLIITGEFDPVTPPKLGEEVAAHLSNSKHIVLKGGSHSGSDICMDQIMADFIKSARPSGVNDLCASQLNDPLNFQTE